MGPVASVLRKQVKRPIRHYNVEERAMKVISKDKPTPAPPHPAMRKVMEEIKRNPNLQSSRTDPKLMKNLENIYITSRGDNPIIRTKTLPTQREPPEEPLFGYDEPVKIPVGKASLRQLLQMITNHSNSPETYTAEKLAREYNLDLVDVTNILQYNKTLIVYNPPAKDSASIVPVNPLRRLQNSIDNLKN